MNQDRKADSAPGRTAVQADWYVAAGDRAPDGPHTAQVVLDRHARGDWPGQFLIWREGMARWLVITDEAELRAVLGSLAAQGRARQGPSAAGAEPPASTEAPGGPGAEPPCLENVSARVCAQMNALAVRLAEDLPGLDRAQQRRYLAFELGTLEYHGRSLLRGARVPASGADPGFTSLLVYHAGAHYPDEVGDVLEYWGDLLRSRGMLVERELGVAAARHADQDAEAAARGSHSADLLRRALGVLRLD